MKLLITVASLGTNSSINLGKLCQSDCVSGRINDSFCKLVLETKTGLSAMAVAHGIDPKI